MQDLSNMQVLLKGCHGAKPEMKFLVKSLCCTKQSFHHAVVLSYFVLIGMCGIQVSVPLGPDSKRKVKTQSEIGTCVALH